MKETQKLKHANDVAAILRDYTNSCTIRCRCGEINLITELEYTRIEEYLSGKTKCKACDRIIDFLEVKVVDKEYKTTVEKSFPDKYTTYLRNFHYIQTEKGVLLSVIQMEGITFTPKAIYFWKRGLVGGKHCKQFRGFVSHIKNASYAQWYFRSNLSAFKVDWTKVAQIYDIDSLVPIPGSWRAGYNFLDRVAEKIFERTHPLHHATEITWKEWTRMTAVAQRYLRNSQPEIKLKRKLLRRVLSQE